MKTLLFLFCFCFEFLVFAQTFPSESADSLMPPVELINTTSNRKPVKIQNGASLEFVKFVPVCSTVDSSIMCETRISGYVTDLILDTVSLDAQTYATRQFNAFDQLYSERKQTTGASYRYTLNLSEVDGVYYSSRLRSKIRNTSMSVLGLSLFTALVVAPLFSLEYKSYGVGTPGGFNRKQYFAIAGTGMAFAAASFSFYILMKPKYFSFAADDYNPKRQRWMLTLAR